MRGSLAQWLALGALIAACSRPRRTEPSSGASSPIATHARPNAVVSPAAGPVAALPPTRIATTERVVAIGDIHGDLAAARAALRTARVIDDANHWSGGRTIAVQCGDVLDRGDDERELLDWFRVVRDEADRAGGRFVMLNGNHEYMNAEADFRYVTPGGYDDFRDYATLIASTPGVARIPEHVRGRVGAFAPGGPYARMLAELNTVIVVGDTVFVHGGLEPRDVAYGLERINTGGRAYFLGESDAPPALIRSDTGPVWSRTYALQSDDATCERLGRTLAEVPARRLVIGHTVQHQGINSACGDRVWRVDVGLARYYDGPIQALEIVGDRVTVLRGSR